MLHIQAPMTFIRCASNTPTSVCPHTMHVTPHEITLIRCSRRPWKFPLPCLLTSSPFPFIHTPISPQVLACSFRQVALPWTNIEIPIWENSLTNYRWWFHDRVHVHNNWLSSSSSSSSSLFFIIIVFPHIACMALLLRHMNVNHCKAKGGSRIRAGQGLNAATIAGKLNFLVDIRHFRQCSRHTYKWDQFGVVSSKATALFLTATLASVNKWFLIITQIAW